MKLYKKNGESLPAVKILPDSDPVPAGYTIVTDIVDASKFSFRLINPETIGFRDRLSYREFVKGLVYTKMTVALPEHVSDQARWDILAPEEKMIACDLFLVSEESFFLGVTGDIKVWDIKAASYRCWSMEARDHRA